MPTGEPQGDVGKRAAEGRNTVQSVFSPSERYLRVVKRLENLRKITNPEGQREERNEGLRELLAINIVNTDKNLKPDIVAQIRTQAEGAFGPIKLRNLLDVTNGLSKMATVADLAENRRSLADLEVIREVAPLFLGTAGYTFGGAIAHDATMAIQTVQKQIERLETAQKAQEAHEKKDQLTDVRAELQKVNGETQPDKIPPSSTVTETDLKKVDPNLTTPEFDSAAVVAEALSHYQTESDRTRLKEYYMYNLLRERERGGDFYGVKAEFAKNATPEARQFLEAIKIEQQKLVEALSKARTKVDETLRQTPCVTHVTTLSHALSAIDQGLLPVSQTGKGMYDQYDKEFPELGLRDVVHCGWGGIDRFSIQDPDTTVVLILDPTAVSPEDKVTETDWSRWGPIYMGKIGGGPNAPKQAVKEYLGSLQTAEQWEMDPYHDVGGFTFITKGREHSYAGSLNIPTVLLPSVPSDKIKGVIIGGIAARDTAKVDKLKEKIPTFSWDELEGVRIDPITGRSIENLQLSQEARFAEAKVDGKGEEFASVFLNEPGTPIYQVRESSERWALLHGLEWTLYDKWRWPGGKVPRL